MNSYHLICLFLYFVYSSILLSSVGVDTNIGIIIVVFIVIIAIAYAPQVMFRGGP